MFKFNFIKQDLNINFLKFKILAMIFSILLLFITFLSLSFNGLNLGIDFKGGILVEFRIKTDKTLNIADFRE
ncbi:MAG: protein translocase subunit SecF, partial [SAR116 cluster bacterium]